MTTTDRQLGPARHRGWAADVARHAVNLTLDLKGRRRTRGGREGRQLASVSVAAALSASVAAAWGARGAARKRWRIRWVSVHGGHAGRSRSGSGMVGTRRRRGGEGTTKRWQQSSGLGAALVHRKLVQPRAPSYPFGQGAF
ncbi:hypothetical protein C2845_PM06G23800 [Panicum miliaceum]|uniref:Uncharacterized protein n=1 Tax=Panicum miliaceum TaxID=4540 RepID=A0A3L6R8A8_PANMI|nr:hypothetical protein C2845_PM06G23800 [Panicum miliaceum]